MLFTPHDDLKEHKREPNSFHSGGLFVTCCNFICVIIMLVNVCQFNLSVTLIVYLIFSYLHANTTCVDNWCLYLYIYSAFTFDTVRTYY